jgi:hypothetical protein
MTDFDQTFIDSVKSLRMWLDWLSRRESEIRAKMERMRASVATESQGDTTPAFSAAPPPPSSSPTSPTVPTPETDHRASHDVPVETTSAPEDDDDDWL